VRHRGENYLIDDFASLPRPVQRPDVPVWVGGFPGRDRPMRRAVRFDGYFPANLEHPDQLIEALALIAELRREVA
jgi:alkanesulfonate monooxygenase SsuD/methylene tetrahydromethanopterin reductase-like flavin-dependent oxidoreductase (luciferase family)